LKASFCVTAKYTALEPDTTRRLDRLLCTSMRRRRAALLAIDRAESGIFNIAKDTGFVSIAKARRAA
jgi:hypothetical protein